MNKTWVHEVSKDGAERAATNSGAASQLLYAQIRFAIEDGIEKLQREEDEVQQILGKALGYPWYKDDQKNFPDATEKDGVCVGDHFAVSLAKEVANRIGRLTEERDNWFETAGMMSRNADYYRGLVERCGRAIGKDAYICDDASISDDVLNAKVPELVEAMCKPKNRFLRALRILFRGK